MTGTEAQGSTCDAETGKDLSTVPSQLWGRAGLRPFLAMKRAPRLGYGVWEAIVFGGGGAGREIMLFRVQGVGVFIKRLFVNPPHTYSTTRNQTSCRF